MYPGLQQQQQHISEDGEGGDRWDDTEDHYNKVDHVCMTVRKVLTKLGANKYLLSYGAPSVTKIRVRCYALYPAILRRRPCNITRLAIRRRQILAPSYYGV
jgi:hypothetical protein